MHVGSLHVAKWLYQQIPTTIERSLNLATRQ
jgi:hypothetical protein